MVACSAVAKFPCVLKNATSIRSADGPVENETMRYVVIVCRCLLGILFAVFGLNTFLWACTSYAFMQPPPPEEMPRAAADFLQALTDAGFMHPLRGVVECLAGLMILSGGLAPLGLILLAPILVHIILYHHFLDPGGTGFSYFILLMWLFLVYAYWPALRGIVSSRAGSRWQPEAADSAAAES